MFIPLFKLSIMETFHVCLCLFFLAHRSAIITFLFLSLYPDTKYSSILYVPSRISLVVSLLGFCVLVSVPSIPVAPRQCKSGSFQRPLYLAVGGHLDPGLRGP